eukprot:11425145-Alexandrium_andersonii.AAC.1
MATGSEASALPAAATSDAAPSVISGVASTLAAFILAENAIPTLRTANSPKKPGTGDRASARAKG